MADNNNLEIVISASDQASAMLESINAKLDKLAQGAQDTEAPVKSLGESFNELTGNLESATQPLADLTTSMLAVESVVVALGAAFVKAGVEDATEFESALTDLAKVLGDQEGTVDAYVPKIKELSAAFGESAIDTAKMAASLKEAGFTADEVFGADGGMGLAETVLTAVKVSSLDASEASEVFVRTLSGFMAPAEEASHLLDILNTTSQTSGASFGDLAEAFGRVGPVASAAGLSFEETAGLLVPLVEQFQSGEIAGTAFNSILLKMGDDTDSTVAAFNALGVAQTDLNGAMLPAGEILENLAKKWPELTKEQQLYYASELVGLEQAPKLQAILSDYPKVLEATETAFQSSGSAVKELAIAMESAEEKFNKASVNFENLSIAVGEKFKPAMAEAASSTGTLAQAIADLIDDGGLDPFFNAITPLIDELATDLKGIAEALPAAFEGVDWTGLEDAIQNIAEAFGEMFGELDLTQPEDLEQAIQALINTFASLTNTTAGVVQGLSPLFEAIGALIGWYNGLDPEIQETVGYLLGLSTTVNTVAGVLGTFSGLISGAGGLISSFTSLNPVVLAAATAFGAFKFGEWVGEITGYNEAWDNTIGKLNLVGETVGVADEALANSATTLDEVASTLGVTSLSMEEFNQAVEDGTLIFDDATGKWVKAGESASDLGDSIAETTQYFDDWGEGANLAGEGTKALAKTTEEAVATLDYWNGLLEDAKAQYESGAISQEEYTAAVKGIDDAAAKAGVNLVTMADQADDTAKSTKEMAEASEEFALEWEKLLSAERTAMFEAQASINVAQIEADAERAVAAMDMLATSFTNTGDVLSELFGLWSEADSLMDQTQLAEWIEREYEIREQLAQAQIDLINAEIARMEAQTAMLENGGMDITIQSDGLEPELEAFMYKILDRIRVQVAGSYQEFLLGCGA